jgi:hypothetical protein
MENDNSISTFLIRQLGIAFLKPKVAGVTVGKKHLSCCLYDAKYLMQTKKFSSRCQLWVYMTSFTQMRGKSGLLRIEFLWFLG